MFNKLYTGPISLVKEAKLAERYIEKQQKDFQTFLKDTSLITKLSNQTATVNEFKEVKSKAYPIFIYDINFYGHASMKFWSNQLVEPSLQALFLQDDETFQQLSNGHYVLLKRKLNIVNSNKQVLVVALVLIRSDYFIETDYLPKEFVFSKDAEKRAAIAQMPTDYPVKSISGKTLFYLDKKITGAVPFNDKLTVFLRLTALLLLALFIQILAESIVVKCGAWSALGLLVLSLISLRLVIYLFPMIFNLRQFELFDPSIYGSNIVQRSLGDLLINAFLLCWIGLFASSKFDELEKAVSKLSKTVKWLIAGFSIVLLLLSTFLLATVVKSIVADSKISFDVTDFFSLNRNTVFGFAALAGLSLFYYYFTQLLFSLLFPLFKYKIIYLYFLISALGLSCVTFSPYYLTAVFYIPVLIWLLIYTGLCSWKGLILNRIRINIAGILFWVFMFSVSIATIMLVENKKAEWERRKNFADKLAVQTDPSSERLLSIGLRYLDDDFLQDNYHRLQDSAESRKIKDSILTENYSGYLGKYDTRLYVFGKLDEPLNNDDPRSYNDLSTLLEVQSVAAKTPGLYYYETSFDKFTYITKRKISDTSGNKLGSLFILSYPKRFSNDALFPELFKQYRQNDPESSPIYSYAVYSKNRLVSPSNKYPFATEITSGEMPKEEYEKRIRGEYVELWYRAGNQKVVVMARKKDTLIETITLFSYIFCAFLFLVVLVRVLSYIPKILSDRQSIRKVFQLNIRAQVHNTIIFVSLFSFLIIGASTISFFINRYNVSNTDRLSRTMGIMVNEMRKELADHSIFDDVLKIYDSAANLKLQKMVDDVSDIHGVDVNVYDLKGDLYISSESNTYTKGVLSKKMEPEAYYYLNKYKLVLHTQREKIGKLTYWSIYAPVRDEGGGVYAYVNIPYFTSQPELYMEISNFLVTIINLNAFIFLIAGLIALFVTNKITHSFSIISDKMKEVNLGKLNEAIEWNRDDEIGGLVKEYNKMVGKLEESANAMAKSEREDAWREMARQVAHEIKNPLTPMKLSIQYLQRAIESNPHNVKELSENVANTLIEQIDHLSKIAADFSQFANIGNSNISEFDLHETLTSLIELFKSDERLQIVWLKQNASLMLRSDRTQMNRLFTNLLTNAVEACNEKKYCKIEIAEEVIDDRVLIRISDDGVGIAEEMRERIFIPNFTTKTSGTGLGLAMCKTIVEQAQGRIWFETEQGVGTSFFVELPLLEDSTQ